MQDKELDELFRSKLDDYRVEPQRGLWDNIAAEVIISKPNRGILPFISVAASILVLIAAGIYFIPQGKVKATKQQQSNAVANNKPEKQIIAPETAKRGVKSKSQTAEQTLAVHIVKQPASKVTRPVVKQQETVILAVHDDAQPDQQMALVQRDQPILQPALPTTAATLTAQADVKDDIETDKIPAATDVRPANNANVIAAAPAKKRGIRNLGDLINVVVSKVDKRKDKLIEFSSNDDDESTISGLNLGIFKVKKD